ncbi:hypothetical protein [Novipirellula sp.]|uniref:hypothetical protein n=1 Tax=Novipirellula sp. TaxID=2795430 RepID=UPI00356666D4
MSTLPRLIARSDTVAENNLGDEDEYRDAEYEYEEDREKAPARASEDGVRVFRWKINRPSQVIAAVRRLEIRIRWIGLGGPMWFGG